MSHAEIDDVGQQLFHALNLIQPLFQQGSDSIVGRQKHGQILTLLKGLDKDRGKTTDEGRSILSFLDLTCNVLREIADH